MRKKTLLGKRNISIILIVILIIGILGGCSSSNEVKTEQTLSLEGLYYELEHIYFSYEHAEAGEPIKEEFDKFLKENFEDGERILKCLKMQDEINENIYENIYSVPIEELKILLQKGKITKEEFDKKDNQLWQKYERAEVQLKELFTEEENKIFESCEEKIELLYSLS